MADNFRIIAPDLRCTLGEGPVWLPDHGRFAWVDILSHRLHSMALDDERISTLQFDEAIGWVIPTVDGGLIGGFASGLWRVDLGQGKRDFIGDPEPDRPWNRLNDAKVDQSGRIWFGTKDDSEQRQSGALYRLDADLRWSRWDDGYGVTNGPTFGSDGRLLYHTDSPQRTIYCFDLSNDGQLSGKRVWLRFEDEWGYPDGMTTDAEGCLWVAHWGGSRISRFTPQGERVQSIDLPALNVTSCCFAGPARDRLFVTSARTDDRESTHGGCLFALDVGVTGAAAPRFAAA